VYKIFLLSIFIVSFIFPNSFLGKYSATTDGGYYTHYFEFYSSGSYSCTILGETSWGDWMEDGRVVKLYSEGFHIENLYMRRDSFSFGGIQFTKIKTSYRDSSSGSSSKSNSPVGTWSDLVESIYGKSPYKITFYSNGSYSESYAGDTSYGNWEMSYDKVVLTGSDGMSSWSGSIYNNKITLKSTNPYAGSFSIQLTKK